MWYDLYWGNIPIDLSGMSKRKLAKYNNHAEFNNIFQAEFTSMVNLFTWSNLPDTCDAAFLERCLLLFGRALIAKVGGSFLTLGGAGTDSVNVYGYPIYAYGWGYNGYNRKLSAYVPGTANAAGGPAGSAPANDAPECVICYDNAASYPYINYIVRAAARMGDLIRACDVAAQGLKSPYLITCDESQVESVKRALDDRRDNLCAIIASRISLSADQFKVWPTALQPDVLRSLWEQYRNIEAQLHETFGINANANTDKRERLLVDEVNSNNEAVHANLQKRLDWRKRFCEEVNETFHLNIGVEVNKDELCRMEDRESDRESLLRDYLQRDGAGDD